MNLISTVARIWTTVALVAAAGATAVVLAQAPAGGQHHDSAAAPTAAQAAPASAEGHQMMKAMAAADQRLTELVTKMNAATGDEKVAAIAAVVTELAAQRTNMQQMMRSHDGTMDCAAKMAAEHGKQ